MEAQMKAAGLLESPVPHGPPPKGISSQRVLPQVREAIRQNDPTSKAASTQPALPKKAPPSPGRGIPAGFYTYQQLLQQLRHIHHVHLSQPFLDQSKNLQHQRH